MLVVTGNIKLKVLKNSEYKYRFRFSVFKPDFRPIFKRDGTPGHWPNWSLPEVVSTRVVTDHNGHRTGGHRPKWSLTQVVTTLVVTAQVVTKIKF